MGGHPLQQVFQESLVIYAYIILGILKNSFVLTPVQNKYSAHILQIFHFYYLENENYDKKWFYFWTLICMVTSFHF